MDEGFVGVVLSKTGTEHPLIISDVIKGGAAEAAGLSANDQILAINNVEANTLTLDEVVNRIRGPVSRSVHFERRGPF